LNDYLFTCSFGYVDYFTVESSTKAIRAPDKHMIDGRKARVEFAGEEAYKRSMPWILREEKKLKENPTGDGAQDQQQQPSERAPREDYPRREQPQGEFRERRERPKKPVNRENLKPGEALATAQRQKPTVQEFKGSKITFD
jgi:RNA recognition motif-containing protein